MCTVLFHQALKLLSKNRDKESLIDEQIVNKNGILAVCSAGSDYFSLGMNQHGIAFVSTAVNSVKWTKAVDNGRMSDAKLIAERENKGLSRPTSVLSEKFSNISSVADGLLMLTERRGPWMGYNVVISDGQQAVVLECFRREAKEYRLPPQGCVTNHFQYVDHGAKEISDYPSSFERYSYVSDRINEIHTIDDFKKVVNPTDQVEAQKIWRNSAFRTVSSTILDISTRSIWRTEGSGGPWQQFKLVG